jgi:hypothetical protein
MEREWKENWENYLKRKFGDCIPTKFVLQLGEIDFYLPPLLGTTPDSAKQIEKHNSKIGVF